MTRISQVCLLASLLVAAACSGAPFPPDAGRYAEMVADDGRIELGVGADGNVTEVEFHVAPTQLPPEVQAAARAELGTLEAAEIEFHGGTMYYEATGRTEQGFEVEAMFLPDGTLHSYEIQVAKDTVPAAIVNGAVEWRGSGEISAWEEIRDGERTLQEYHVKKMIGGKRYKMVFTIDGQMTVVYRETPAEIEVPVR